MRDADLTLQHRRALPLRALIWLAAAALAVFALTRLLEPAPAPEPAIRQSSAGGATFDDALAQIDAKLAGLRQLAAANPEDWLMLERLAQQLMARARLTGSFADYAEAQRALDRGFASATPGAGPHLTQAALALSSHRLDLAEKMLDAIDRYAVPAEAEVRAGVLAMRGDIALNRGQYRAAEARYRELSTAGERPDQRIAIFWARTGRPEDALAAIRRVERAGLMTGQSLAQLALLRGAIALQSGDWDAADAAFFDAERRFPGWWLTGAHRAQMLALRGRTDEAIAGFTKLTARNDDPSLRDALASLYRARGDHARTTLWAARAGVGWAERLRLLPEAGLGHAAEHELAFGTPERALALARRDYLLRPHGATAVTLGWALIASNRPAEALRLMAAVDRSSWRSAEQHLVAARAHALLGQGDAARGQEAKALRINPRATEPSAALLWFGH